MIPFKRPNVIWKQTSIYDDIDVHAKIIIDNTLRMRIHGPRHFVCCAWLFRQKQLNNKGTSVNIKCFVFKHKTVAISVPFHLFVTIFEFYN